MNTAKRLIAQPLRVLGRASLIFAVASGVGCGGGGGDGPVGPDTSVATVTVSGSASEIESGATLQLSAQAKNAAGGSVNGKSFTWSSSDTQVAQVSESGRVTGGTPGTATITATERDSGRSGTLALTVKVASVGSVGVTPTTVSLNVGQTEQLSVELRDARGVVLSDRQVTWTSSDESVATVSGSGLVTAVKAGGPVTVTASAEGKSGTTQVTVTAPATPVATVTLSPTSATITQGGTQQLTATLRDAGGASLSGRTITWSSSDANVARVDGDGLVSGVAVGGPVTITATAEGKSATAQVTVTPRTAAGVILRPQFSTRSVNESEALAVEVVDASGAAIDDATVSWTSGAAAIATVSDAGVVRGVSVGQAAIIARADAAVDTAWVAVLGSSSLLSTAFEGETAASRVKPGATITVPVVLDMSRVSTDGDLGAIQFDLIYDPAVLVYQSAQPGISGSASTNLSAAGTFRYSFAGTEKQGSASLTLVTVTFQVAGSASVGTHGLVRVEYTADPVSTGFTAYSRPVSVPARIRVVAP